TRARCTVPCTAGEPGRGAVDAPPGGRTCGRLTATTDRRQPGKETPATSRGSAPGDTATQVPPSCRSTSPADVRTYSVRSPRSAASSTASATAGSAVLVPDTVTRYGVVPASPSARTPSVSSSTHTTDDRGDRLAPVRSASPIVT